MSEENPYYPVIGIDLGTTYSAVASYNNDTGQAEILKNKTDGFSDTTPSVVSMDALTRKAIVGAWAKRNGANDPRNTIIEIKREMGEEFNAETIGKFNANKIFNIGEPVKAYLGGEWLMPQEISAFTLMRMKQVAEEVLGQPVIDAVVTVPAYFTEKQKSATREAVLLAGLYPRQIIPEPTAAAICYGVDQYESERKRYLVYDLGGGTFDVSIIEVEEQNVEVIATSGDPRLGGGDFDDTLRDWAVKELKDNYQIDVSTNPRALSLIKLRAEEVKIKLSTFVEETLNLGELNPQNPPMLKITRELFEGLILGLLNKSLSYVDMAITKASERGVTREDIDAILLVGGSSKMPRIRQLLLEYFQKGEDFVRGDANPDAVVARGAALLAHQFKQSPQPFDILKQPSGGLVNTDMDEEDVLGIRLITEHSLGVAVQDGRFMKIVGSGTNIPVSATEGGFTNAGPTTEVEVHVYQGEGDFVRDCTPIGLLRLGPMDPQPKGSHHFEVTFSLDENGLLAMTVHHINTGQKYEAQFDQNTAVGGDEALATMHRKLLGMYGGGAPEDEGEMPDPQGGPETTGKADAAPSSPYDALLSQTPGHAAPSGATPAAPADGRAQAPEDHPQADTAASRTGQAAPGEQQGASEITETAAISVTIPAEFKQLVRRSLKQIEKQYNEKLVSAFNQFAAALNTGADEDDIMDLGDQLADAFDDARLGNS